MLATVSKLAWTDLELAPHTYTSSVRVTLFCQDIGPVHYVSSDSLSHSSNHRTDRLQIDSQFNLPANVSIAIDVANENNTNINGDELVANGNNPQNGAAVSMTFMDFNLNSTQDVDAVSG